MHAQIKHDGSRMENILVYWSIKNFFHIQSSPLKINPTPSSLHQMLHLEQSSQSSTILLATTKPRVVHQIARQRFWLQTALESSKTVFYTTASHYLLSQYLVVKETAK